MNSHTLYTICIYFDQIYNCHPCISVSKQVKEELDSETVYIHTEPFTES